MADNKEKKIKAVKPERAAKPKTEKKAKAPKQKKLRTYQMRQDISGYAFMATLDFRIYAVYVISVCNDNLFEFYKRKINSLRI